MFFSLHEVLFTLLNDKKNKLCNVLYFNSLVAFFKVKPMLVWLVSTIPYLLILLLALTYSEGRMLLPTDENSISR